MLLKKCIFFSRYNIKVKYYWVFCVIKKIFFFSGHNIKMLEITIDNCYKCDLETIIDPNNSQYFWINRRDLEIETKCNWQVIFDKYKDLSTQKYRKELTPNITFQSNKIFVRNDLFEKIIKSCKTTKNF